MGLLRKMASALNKTATALEPETFLYEVVFEEKGKVYEYHKTEKEMTQVLNEKWYRDDKLPFSVKLSDGSTPTWTLTRPPAIKGYNCRRCGDEWGTRRKDNSECKSCGSYQVSVIRKDT